MAKHISFGTPVNEAERWAFGVLADELPEDYFLLTNIEIPTKSGQAMEVDALVVGEWGVYVVDVKGYIGHLNAGLHAWSLDGRDVDNSLSKANYVARVLAGKVKHQIPVGVYAPWCQGMVFVTGRKGEQIELEKDDGSLSIYTPKQIINALTNEWGLTAPIAHQVTHQQKELVLDTIGQVALVEQRNNRIQDFIKLKCLFMHHGLEVWQAEYSPGEWTAPWLLKILIPMQFDDPEQLQHHEQALRNEFKILQELSGCCTVPYCAPLIQDGEQLVLPIRMPRGMPLNALESETLTTYQILEILRRSVTGLQQIHRRGYSIGGWSSNCIFVSTNGDVEYIDIKNNISIDNDIAKYAYRFKHLAEQTQQPRIYQWYRLAEKGSTIDLDALRCDLSALLESGVCDVEPTAIEIKTGAVVDHHYLLEQQIICSDDSELWLAKHIQGQYQCGIGLYKNVVEHWPKLSNLYRSLSHIYHPHIERVLAFGQLPQTQDLFIVRNWIKGLSLDELTTIELGQPKLWFKQLLTALQYIHQMDIYHGAICPKNIICNSEVSILVNFGLGMDIASLHYAQQYADPIYWEIEGDAEKDLYGLVASFVDVLSEHQTAEQLHTSSLLVRLELLDRELLGETVYQLCKKVLKFEYMLAPNSQYLALFGFDD
ncbi:NERD domain-containing protein kinase family protein [Shewanella marina]|uniref:NERD domain-containing protein kinase family protein n=1 Tax=Shewanella marina TaxID=487319 RepID=UPI00046F6F8E|nr:NERD domain-containing protein kinase family protein [Shewanella marina]